MSWWARFNCGSCVIPDFWFQALESSNSPSKTVESDGEIYSCLGAVVTDNSLVQWPSTYEEDSDSTAPPLLQELLFIEQNVRRAVAINKDETHNWPENAARADHVYQSWLAAGRPSASEILASTPGQVPRPPVSSPSKLSMRPASSPISPHSIAHPGDPQNLSDEHPPPTEVDCIASVEADELEDKVLAELEQTISDAEKAIASYTELAVNESKESAAVLKGLIKKKEKVIAEAHRKIAAMSSAPKVKRYSRFTAEKRQRALAVIETARKAVHEFAVEENLDPTIMQRLLQGKLITNGKNSAWDAWEGLMAIARQSGGVDPLVFIWSTG